MNDIQSISYVKNLQRSSEYNSPEIFTPMGYSLAYSYTCFALNIEHETRNKTPLVFHWVFEINRITHSQWTQLVIVIIAIFARNAMWTVHLKQIYCRV